MRVLLVNPPIYDFSAYDFWLKPHGLLRVGGALRGRAEMKLFDFLDRLHPLAAGEVGLRSDEWGRGEFLSYPTTKPAALESIRRRYRRFGLPSSTFEEFLRREEPFDVALVGSGMTYWYPGVREVIETLHAVAPGRPIVLGGVYATLCPEHARSLGADLVVEGGELAPLWQMLGVEGNLDEPPLWEGYERLAAGTVRISEGCPMRCTYCAVPVLTKGYSRRPRELVMKELGLLAARKCANVAFYDDALLTEAEEGLTPLLEEVMQRGWRLNLHTPNALQARLVTGPLAALMVRTGFKTFHLGFESAAADWQQSTGGKVRSEELSAAVAALKGAGVAGEEITAYVILGHPQHEAQEAEQAMHFVHELGIRVMLSEFSPIPGTPDGEDCGEWVDLSEPLWHNKTAFTEALLGSAEVNRLKDLCRQLNGKQRQSHD